MNIYANSKLPEMMAVDPRFLKGLHLFNEGDYFEAHDAVEELWLQTPSNDPMRNLYKGVIQAAAALYQQERGVFSGARALHKTSVGYLEKYAPAALGLDVRRMVGAMNAYFSDPANAPKPVLEFEK